MNMSGEGSLYGEAPMCKSQMNIFLLVNPSFRTKSGSLETFLFPCLMS